MGFPSLTIGPIFIQSTYLIWGLGALVAFLWIIIINIYHKNSHGRFFALEWIQSLLLIAIIWKFSYVLNHPIKAVQSPERMLYLNGGSLGLVLGIVISFIFYTKSIHKAGFSFIYSINLWMSAQLLWLGITQIAFTLGFTVYNTPLWLYGYFVALSLSYFFVKNLYHYRTIVYYTQLTLLGWVVYRVFFTTIHLGDLAVWFSFVMIIGLYYVDYAIKKGREAI
ncbi:hypothetical protein N780_11505 [Pontibacillus chungwhensis BH030062]|uniref:Prolipoprotein diacylglyceryl transferase n=1 Tax=Pontibacillus chungwhensis BH030062 TaxID=1385513 RepID=A0A0A2V395_9BACI|nr:hypothetical protein [Pontibacillus chungwhensis]KGP93281.1 hypothetical protein N780_11505 [Pontibacillus chungwhensis BH030062]